MSTEVQPTPVESSAPAKDSESSGAGASSRAGASPRAGTGKASLRGMDYSSGMKALAPGANAMLPNAPGSDPQSIAAAGFAGASKPLDSALVDKFQASTGVDISHGRKHTGPEAAAACEALGVEGFALGSNVALAPNANLTVELHEYAHIAHQTGIQTDHESVAPGADLEVEADEVAAAVLRGEKARVSTGIAEGIQRKGNDTSGGKSGPKKLSASALRLTPAEIKAVYGAEASGVAETLSGKSSDADVTAVLELCSMWDNETITAFWRHAVKPKWLEDFVDNVGETHFASHPRESLYTLRAVKAADRGKLILKLTDDGIFDSVDGEEAHMTWMLMSGLDKSWIKWFREERSDQWTNYCKALPRDAREKMQAALDVDQDRKRKKDESERRQGVYDSHQEAQKDSNRDGKLKYIIKRLKGGTSDKDAIEVHRIFEGLPYDTIGYYVRKLEEGEWIEEYIDELPDEYKYGKTQRVTFLKVLTFRPAPQVLAYAEELMSYGLFDWAIREWESKLAYYLIKAQPVAVQRKFREKDNGKWLKRMETHLGEDVVVSKEAVGSVNSEGEVEDAGFSTASTEEERKKHAEEDAKLKGSKDFWAQFLAIKKQLEGNEESVKTAYSALAETDATVRSPMVRRLDALGLIEDMINTLGFDYIWDDQRNLVTLQLLKDRDPMRNVEAMSALLTYGLFNWVITSTEAYLAFNLMKTLPKDYQERVHKQNPTWWDTMMAEMSDDQIESDDLNTYNGGEGGKDRSDIIGQLVDPELWREDNGQQLGNVLRMAMAAGNRRLANETAIKNEAFSKHSELMESLAFVSDMENYKADGLDNSGPEGVFQTIYEGGNALVQSIDMLGQSDEIDLVNKVGGKGIELDEVDDIFKGERIAGVRFKQVDEGEADDKINTIDAEIDPAGGAMHVTGEHIEIDSIIYPMATVQVRTGCATLKGLKLDATFPTEKSPQQESHFFLSMDEFTIHDIVVVHADGMLAISSVTVRGVTIEMHELPVSKEALGKGDRAAAIFASLQPAPTLLQQALDAKDNTATDLTNAITGGAMGGLGGVSLTIDSMDIEGMTSSDGTKIDDIKVKGLEVHKEALPSHFIERQLTAWAADKKAKQAELASLSKDERDPKLVAARKSRLEAEITGLDTKMAEAKSRQGATAGEEARLIELYTKQRNGEILSADDQAEFVKLKGDMAEQAGVVMKLDGLKMEGLGHSTDKKAEKGKESSVEIGRVTASAQGAIDDSSLGLGHLADPSLAAQIAGTTPDGRSDMAARGNVDIDISSVEGKNLKVGGSVPDYGEQNKRRKELQQKAAAFTAEWDNVDGEGLEGDEKTKWAKARLNKKEVDELKDLKKLWLSTVDDYSGLSDKSAEKFGFPKSSGSNTYGTIVGYLMQMERAGLATVDQDTELATDRQTLRALLKTAPMTVESVHATGVKIEVDGSASQLQDGTELDEDGNAKTDTHVSGKASISVGELEAKNIDNGSTTVGSVKGTDLKAEGRGDLGKMASGRLTGGDYGGTVSAGTLEINDLEDRDTGVKVKKIEGEGLSVGLDVTHGTDADGNMTTDGKATIAAKRLKVTTLHTKTTRQTLEEGIAAIDAKTDASAQDKAKRTKLQEKLDHLGAVEAQLKVAKADLEAYRTKAESDGRKDLSDDATWERLTTALANAETAVAAIERGQMDARVVEVKNFSASVDGLGDPMAGDWDLAGRELTISVMLGGKAEADKPPENGSLEIEGLNYAGGSGMRVDCPKASLRGGLEVLATVEFERDEKEGGLKLKTAHLQKFHVGELEANNLNLAIPVQGELVEINVPRAFLKNIDVNDIPLTNFDPLKMKGNVTADEVDVKFGAKIGDYFKAQGGINAKKLRVGSFQGQGKGGNTVEFGFDELTLEKLGYSTEKGKVPSGSIIGSLEGSNVMIDKVEAGKTNIALDRDTGALTFNVDLPLVDVSSASISGGGHALTVGQKLRATKIRVKGNASLDMAVLAEMLKSKEDTDPAKAAEEKEVSVLKDMTLEEVDIGRIDGADIHYWKGKDTHVHIRSGWIEGVRLRDYVQSSGALGSLKVKGGGADIHADITQAITKGKDNIIGSRIITADGNVNVGAIEASKGSDGKTVFELNDLGSTGMNVEVSDTNSEGYEVNKTTANVSGGMKKLSGEMSDDGKKVDAKFEGGNLHGNVTNTDGKTTLKTDIGVDNLSGSFNKDGANFGLSVEMDQAHLGALDLTTAVSGVPLHVVLASANLAPVTLRLSGTSYEGAELEKREKEGKSTVKYLQIEELNVPKATFTTLNLDYDEGGSAPLNLVVPSGHMDRLVIKNLIKDGDDKIATAGAEPIKVGELGVTGLKANYGGWLKAGGNATATDIKIGLLSDGNFNVDIPTIQATAVDIAAQGDGSAVAVSLEKLNARSTKISSNHKGTGLTGFETKEIDFEATAAAGATVNKSEASKVDTGWDLELLQNMSGSITVKIPTSKTSHFSITIPVPSLDDVSTFAENVIAATAAAADIHGKGMQIGGIAVPDPLARMLIIKAGEYLSGPLASGLLDVRNDVVVWTNNLTKTKTKGGGPDTDKPLPDVQALANEYAGKAVKELGSAAALIDVLAPDGAGAGKLAEETAKQWGREFLEDQTGIPLNSKGSGKKLEKEQFERRKKALYAFFAGIGIELAIGGTGSLTGWEGTPDKHWVNVHLEVDLDAAGSLATGVKLDVELTMTDLEVLTAGAAVKVKEIHTKIDGKALTSKGLFGIGAGAKGTGKGIDVTLTPGPKDSIKKVETVEKGTGKKPKSKAPAPPAQPHIKGPKSSDEGHAPGGEEVAATDASMKDLQAKIIAGGFEGAAGFNTTLGDDGVEHWDGFVNGDLTRLLEFLVTKWGVSDPYSPCDGTESTAGAQYGHTDGKDTGAQHPKWLTAFQESLMALERSQWQEGAESTQRLCQLYLKAAQQKVSKKGKTHSGVEQMLQMVGGSLKNEQPSEAMASGATKTSKRKADWCAEASGMGLTLGLIRNGLHFEGCTPRPPSSGQGGALEVRGLLIWMRTHNAFFSGWLAKNKHKLGSGPLAPGDIISIVSANGTVGGHVATVMWAHEGGKPGTKVDIVSGNAAGTAADQYGAVRTEQLTIAEKPGGEYNWDKAAAKDRAQKAQARGETPNKEHLKYGGPMNPPIPGGTSLIVSTTRTSQLDAHELLTTTKSDQGARLKELGLTTFDPHAVFGKTDAGKAKLEELMQI